MAKNNFKKVKENQFSRVISILPENEAFEVLNPDELKSKFKLSDEDVKFYLQPVKMLEENGTIGLHKYNYLIEKRSQYNNWNVSNPDAVPKELSDLEKAQIIQYETDKSILDREKQAKHTEYLQSVRSDEKKPIETIKGIELNKSNLYHGFKQVFKVLTGTDFEETPDTLANIEPIVKYFAKDESFKNCKRLIVNLEGSLIPLEPSFDKGLLIIGNYGNGKSTILKCFEYMISHNYKIAVDKHWDNVYDWKNARFKIVNCHDLVSEFEGLSSPNAKKAFYQKYSTFRYSFDDLKKEKLASNYGITNVVQSVLEKRYDGKVKTFGTCNYPENEPNDLNKALYEFSTKYGGHVYDRVFQMFNIIEFQGKSFRK